MISEHQIFQKLQVDKEEKWMSRVNLLKVQALFQCPVHFDSNKFNQNERSTRGRQSHALVQETLFCQTCQCLICPICALHGETGSFNDGLCHDEHNREPASQVILRSLFSLEQLYGRIVFYVDNIVKQSCVTREIIEKIDVTQLAPSGPNNQQTLLPAMHLKDDGLNSGVNSKLPQVEIRKIRNGDRADLVAYGPKSSIDQFQKMYQELTKKIAEEESDGDESSDVDGDDDSSRSSESDHSFGFPTKGQTQQYTINPRKADNDGSQMPPAQILIDATALLNTKNRRKQKQKQKTFEYKQASRLQQSKTNTKEASSSGAPQSTHLKVTTLEADASTFKDVLGVKSNINVTDSFNQEKVSNSWESNKGQHGASVGKPHSLSFDSINNQSNQINSLNCSEKKEESSVQDEIVNEIVVNSKNELQPKAQKESVNERYNRLLDLLKNEPQAMTYFQQILKLEKQIESARDAIYNILDKKVTHQEKQKHFATLSHMFPEESPEAQILRVSLTTLTKSRLLSILDSLKHIIDCRLHYDFLRLHDLCQILRQQLERQIFRAFYAHIQERVATDPNYRMSDAEQKLFLQNQQADLDLANPDEADLGTKDDMNTKIMNPQKYYAPRRHQRMHDPYNYSDKTSTDSSDDYFDQVVDEVQGVTRGHGSLDSSDNPDDTFGSSNSSDESTMMIAEGDMSIGGDDCPDGAELFAASKGKAPAHGQSFNVAGGKSTQAIYVNHQKTRSRQIAKNKWRKQIRLRRNNNQKCSQSRRQDVAAIGTTMEGRGAAQEVEQPSLIQQIIGEYETAQQSGKLSQQQVEVQAKLINHLKKLNEVIVSQNAKGQPAAQPTGQGAGKQKQTQGAQKQAVASAGKSQSAKHGNWGTMILDDFYYDDLLIEELYRINELQQREALMAEIQIYLFETQKDLTNEQISHAVQVMVDIDRKHLEIIIENFERIEEVLDECQCLIADNDIDDLAKLDLKDFKDDETQAHSEKTNSQSSKSQKQQQASAKKSLDAKNIIEELKSKIVEQKKSQKEMFKDKFDPFKQMQDKQDASHQLSKVLEDYMKSSVNLITPHDDIRQKQEQLSSMQSLYFKVSQLHQKIGDSLNSGGKYEFYSLTASKSKRGQKSAAGKASKHLGNDDLAWEYGDEDEYGEVGEEDYDDILKDFSHDAAQQPSSKKRASKRRKSSKSSQDQQETIEIISGSVGSSMVEDNDVPPATTPQTSTAKKNKNRKKKTKKVVKDQDLQLLSEYALTIKYSSDPQLCDINRNRKNNNEIYSRPKLYCAKQLLNQNKNIIFSIGLPAQNVKDTLQYPVIYDHSQFEAENQQQQQQMLAGQAGKGSTGSGQQAITLLKTVKYTLANWDIPYFEENHPVYCILEIDNFVVTGHAHGYIAMWETQSCGKRVINQYLPCIDRSGKEWNEALGQINLQSGQYDITGIIQVNKTIASSLIIVCCQSGELMILKINGRNRTIDLIHLVNVQQQQQASSTQQSQATSSKQSFTNRSSQGKEANQSKQRGGKMQNAQNMPKKSSLYGLSKLGDGRFVLLSSKGFTIWQVQGLQQPNSQSKLSVAQKNVLQSQIKLQQQSKVSFIPEEAISQVIELQSNTVVCSTMSCNYYMVNLKNGQIEAKIQGRGRYAVELVRAPAVQRPTLPVDAANTESPQVQIPQNNNQAQSLKFCGIESNCIVLIDFEKDGLEVLQEFAKTEFKQPWYSAAFYLKDRPDLLVVGEEQSGQPLCLQCLQIYKNQKPATASTDKASGTLPTYLTDKSGQDAQQQQTQPTSSLFGGAKDQPPPQQTFSPNLTQKLGLPTKTGGNVMF